MWPTIPTACTSFSCCNTLAWPAELLHAANLELQWFANELTRRQKPYSRASLPSRKLELLGRRATNSTQDEPSWMATQRLGTPCSKHKDRYSCINWNSTRASGNLRETSLQAVSPHIPENQAQDSMSGCNKNRRGSERRMSARYLSSKRNGSKA